MFEPANYISGIACDHYYRFRDDFKIIKRLGHNATRFSLEWSRIEPIEGEFNEKEIEHYRKVVATLKGLKIEPDVKFWITLNEPEVYTSHSYLIGAWPPLKKNLLSCLIVTRNLIEAHRKTYATIKKLNQDAQIGIAKNITYFEAYQNKLVNRLLKK